MKLTPFPLNECAICDGPTVVGLADETGEVAGYCRKDADMILAEFPATKVFPMAVS